MIQKVSSFLVLLLPATAFCQLPSSQCDSAPQVLQSCPYFIESRREIEPLNPGEIGGNLRESRGTLGNRPEESSEPNSPPSEMFVQSAAPKQHGFHWGRALFESC